MSLEPLDPPYIYHHIMYAAPSYKVTGRIATFAFLAKHGCAINLPEGCQFLVYSTLLPPPSLRCSYNRLFKCVQAPICMRSAIYLSVIVVSCRSCAASPIF